MSTPRLLPRLFRLPRQQTFNPRAHFSTTRAHFNNTAAPPPPPKPSLSARLKHLSKEYGYSALGVYLALSALDFPFCFLAVRTIGSERIGEYEEAVVARVRGWYAAARSTVRGGGGVLPEWKGKETTELQEAREKRQSASIWTELALAYAVHKSLIFIRVPITAAVTPRVVKTLRGWGWDIGRKGGPVVGKVPGKKD